MMLVNEDQYYQLTVEKLDRILDGFRKGVPVTPDEPTPLLGNVGAGRRSAAMSANGTVRLVSRNFAAPGQATIDGAMQRGAYEMFKRALKMKPEEVTTLVKASGLRGHGGAGFFAGTKWGFIPKDKFPRYVCVNADESEPGTCKDRLILEYDPHLMLEGALICAWAVQAECVYIYVRGEYFYPMEVLEKAIAEAKAKGFWGENILGSGWSCQVHTATGAGQYICGEETASDRVARRQEGLAAP